jgi:uncharacterized membrane protein
MAVPSSESSAPRGSAMHKLLRSVSRVAGAAAVVLLVLYPFAAYLSFRSLRPGWLAGLLIAASLLRLLAAGASGTPLSGSFLLVPVGGIALALWSLLRATPDAMLYYPVLVNAALLAVFGYSLLRPPTVIERIAQVTDAPRTPEGIRYTRRVTIAWVVFFLVNGGIALYTALLTSLNTWALYNGFIAYLLIAALFGGEWLIRGRVRAAQRK